MLSVLNGQIFFIQELSHSSAVAPADERSTKNIALTANVANIKFFANLLIGVHSLVNLSLWCSRYSSATIIARKFWFARLITRRWKNGHSRRGIFSWSFERGRERLTQSRRREGCFCVNNFDIARQENHYRQCRENFCGKFHFAHYPLTRKNGKRTWADFPLFRYCLKLPAVTRWRWRRSVSVVWRRRWRSVPVTGRRRWRWSVPPMIIMTISSMSPAISIGRRRWWSVKFLSFDAANCA